MRAAGCRPYNVVRSALEFVGNAFMHSGKEGVAYTPKPNAKTSPLPPERINPFPTMLDEGAYIAAGASPRPTRLYEGAEAEAKRKCNKTGGKA